MACFSSRVGKQDLKEIIKDWLGPQPDSAIQPKPQELLHMKCEFITHYIKDDSKPKHSIVSTENRKYLEDYAKHSMDSRSTRSTHWIPEALEPLHDACGIRLQRAQRIVKPGAAGLLKFVEWSRIRDSTWHVPYPLVTTWLSVELVDIQGNYSIVLE